MLAEYESLLACVPKSARECGTRQGKKLLPKGNLTVALSEEMVRTLLYLMSHEQGFTAGGGTAVPWNQVAKLNNRKQCKVSFDQSGGVLHSTSTTAARGAAKG